MDSTATGGGRSTGRAERVQYTAVGLFEDNLDTEEALAALRKANVRADQISVVVRDPDVGDENPAERAIAVARAVAATALEHVGNWLQGLAALIVPERGTFVVAGPLGAALAGISAAAARLTPVSMAEDGSDGSTDADLDEAGGSPLVNTLVEFGFGEDEAIYLEHRLSTGAPLIGVTSGDRRVLAKARQIFAANNAVHIGTAQTDARIAEEAKALLAAAPEASSGGDVVVTDAVAPLRKLCDDADATWAGPYCDRLVVDATGVEVGAIDDLLADFVPNQDAAGERSGLHYVIVGFGGVLGLGRRRVAVPAGEVDLDRVPVRLSITKDVVQHAPAFDIDTPFSRREEQAVCAYFGCTPYWLTE